MLRFLTDELQAAEDAGQRVWILGHVLPGSSLLICLVIMGYLMITYSFYYRLGWNQCPS